MLTITQLTRAVPGLTAARAALFHPAIVKGATQRGWNRMQLARFLAQVGHESGGFRILVENLNYTTAARIVAVWPGRFTLATAQPFVRNPVGLGNHVYNGRMGNRVGTMDGFAFRGRGLPHITGRTNYLRCSEGLFQDARLLEAPALLEEPAHAVASAFWFWDTNKLASITNFTTLTRRINGGTTGMQDRLMRLEVAVGVLG